MNDKNQKQKEQKISSKTKNEKLSVCRNAQHMSSINRPI
jgi:hypothetical protein